MGCKVDTVHCDASSSAATARCTLDGHQREFVADELVHKPAEDGIRLVAGGDEGFERVVLAQPGFDQQRHATDRRYTGRNGHATPPFHQAIKHKNMLRAKGPSQKPCGGVSVTILGRAKFCFACR